MALWVASPCRVCAWGRVGGRWDQGQQEALCVARWGQAGTVWAQLIRWREEVSQEQDAPEAQKALPLLQPTWSAPGTNGPSGFHPEPGPEFPPTSGASQAQHRPKHMRTQKVLSTFSR